MNPWTRYVQSLIYIPGRGEPAGRAILMTRKRTYDRIPFEAKACAPCGSRCASCGVRHQELHIGYCAEERCPACNGYLTMCGCFHERMPPWTRPILIH